MHDNTPIEIDAARGVSQLATDNVTLSSYEDQPRSKKIANDANRYFELVKMTVPLAVVGFLAHIPTVITGMMCGHLNSTVQQSAASLAMSTCNYIGFSFILGLVTAMECMGSQAAGAGKRICLGLITARTIAICIVASSLITILWFYSEKIFDVVTSTKPEVDELAGDLLRVYSMILPVFSVDVAMTRYAIILGYVVEIMVVRLLSVVFQIILGAILLFVLNLELVGAMIALILAEIAGTVSTVYIVKKYGALQEVTSNLNYNMFRGWPALLKLGMPGIAMIVAESIFIEVTIMILSKSDLDHYDAFLQLLQYHQFYFHMYHGFTIAGAIITGKNLGMQDSQKAKRDMTYFLWFCVVCGTTFAFITIVLRDQVAYILSETLDVQEILGQFIPVYCVYLVLDCTQVSMSGVLRGMGKQAIGALIYIVSLCVIGLISSYILTGQLSSSGLAAWISLSIGSGTALAAIWYVILRADWKKETLRAMERLGLVDRGSMEMKQLNGSRAEEEQLEFNPFTNELLESEKAPLFNKASSGNQVGTEEKITIAVSGMCSIAMFISIIFYFILG